SLCLTAPPAPDTSPLSLHDALPICIINDNIRRRNRSMYTDNQLHFNICTITWTSHKAYTTRNIFSSYISFMNLFRSLGHTSYNGTFRNNCYISSWKQTNGTHITFIVH